MPVYCWERKGLVWKPESAKDTWVRSHAQMPTLLPCGSDHLKIFLTCRDEQNRSRPIALIFNLVTEKIDDLNLDPILDFGLPGTFDDSGVMPSCVMRYQGRVFLYYIGWNVPSNLPFRNSIGLAISDDDGRTFRKFSDGPVLDRNLYDPYYVSTPFVLEREGRFRMWYLSGLPWQKLSEERHPRSFYHIKCAESTDGIFWKTSPDVSIALADSHEAAVARPWVIYEGARYRMWYSRRWDHYKMGYAESTNGTLWKRLDDLNSLNPADVGWDSEQICYPAIYHWNNSRYLFYNGNEYGRWGVGYAISKSETR